MLLKDAQYVFFVQVLLLNMLINVFQVRSHTLQAVLVKCCGVNLSTVVAFGSVPVPQALASSAGVSAGAFLRATHSDNSKAWFWRSPKWRRWGHVPCRASSQIQR